MHVSRETLMAVPLYGTYVAAKAIHDNKREMKKADKQAARQYISNKKMENQTYKMYLIPVLGTIYGLFKALVRNYQQKQLLKAFDEIKGNIEVVKQNSSYKIFDIYHQAVANTDYREPAPYITNDML